MRLSNRYYTIHWLKALKLFGLISVLCLFLIPTSFGQNTKGDKPQASSGSKRESRFKLAKKKKVKGKKSYNRVQSKRSSKANRAQSSQQGKIYSQNSSFVNNSSRTEKDAKRNLRSSRTTRVRGRSSSIQTRNVYPQQGPYVNNPSKVPDRKPPKIVSNKSRIKAVSKTKSISSTNVYKQFARNANNINRPRKERPYIVKNYSPGYKRVKTPPKDSQQKWRAKTTSFYGVRSVSGRTKNVYSQKGPYIHNPSQKSRGKKSTFSNRTQIAQLRSSRSVSGEPGKRKRVRGASASRPYISRKSINAFAGFWNKKPKGERPYTSGDIAGHKLRKKNYETKIPIIVNPTANPYTPKKSVGDLAYQGKTKPKYKTVTRSGRAWSGDITGRKIRGRNHSSKTTIAGRPIFPPQKSKVKKGDTPYKGRTMGGYQSATQKRKKKLLSPLQGKNPGGIANQIDGYSGSLKFRQRKKGGGSVSGKKWNNDEQSLSGTPPLRRNIGLALFSGKNKRRVTPKGGGSVSGKLWNNQNTPLVGKGPSGSSMQAGSFRGNSKGRRPLKGGGTVSGKINNNQRLVGKTPSGVAVQIGAYSGNLKGRKPLKGGGSVSGKIKNNQPLVGKTPSGVAVQIGAYSGNLKGRKPLKGGGSVSGRINSNKPLVGRTPSSTSLEMGSYSGNLKGQRPLKGGGSISGKIWNNNESPLTGKAPRGQRGIDLYQGNIKAVKRGASKAVAGFTPRKYRDTKPAMRDQGEEYTGHIKVRKSEPSKQVGGFAPNKYKDLKPAMRDQGEEFTGFIKLPRFNRGYIKNPNSVEASLKKARPDKTTYEVNGLQVKVKQKRYGTKPNAADGSLKGIVASKSSIKASEYSKVLKLKYAYIHNPSASKDALKTREPYKAFGKGSDYQGNIKMKKFDLFRNKELHPDAQFVKTNKNNVDSERSMLTNFKLFWAKMFGKDDLQPDNVKEKERKPRYKKDEGEIWYNQHNSSPGRSNSLKSAKTPEGNK